MISLKAFIFSLLNDEAGFYKPIILSVLPPICGITAHATMQCDAMLWNISFSFFLLQAWVQINGLLSVCVCVCVCVCEGGVGRGGRTQGL
jgi:hypothetical protein